MKIQGTTVGSGSGRADTILAYTLFGSISTGTLGLCESEVIVGAHVESFDLFPGHLEGIIVVLALTSEKGDVSAGNTGGWSAEAVVKSLLQSSDVKVVEIAVQRSITVLSFKIGVLAAPESLAEEIPNVPEYDKDEIREIGGEHDKVRRFVFYRLLELPTGVMLTDIFMARMQQRSELCVLPSGATSFFRRKNNHWGFRGMFSGSSR